jgi:hypothetical protein
MSERNASGPAGTGTAEIPVVRPEGATAAPAPAAVPPVPGPEPVAPSGTTEEAAAGAGADVPVAHPTAPVTVRPRPRMPRRGPLTVMGPWAPVAGAALGLLLGLVSVLFLAGSAHTFTERLALVLVVVGLGMLGTGGTLLADEVRMLRQQAREAVVRPGLVEVTAGLLNGLTPARLLVGVSAFLLFLAAYVSR